MSSAPPEGEAQEPAERVDLGTASFITTKRNTLGRLSLWGAGLAMLATTFIKSAWPRYKEYWTEPIPGFKWSVQGRVRWVQPHEQVLTVLGVATVFLVFTALMYWAINRYKLTHGEAWLEGEVLVLQQAGKQRRIALEDIASVATSPGAVIQLKNGTTIALAGLSPEATAKLVACRPPVDTVSVPRSFRQMPAGNAIAKGVPWIGFLALLAGWGNAGQAFAGGGLGGVVAVSMLSAAWLGASLWLARDKRISIGTDGVRIAGSAKSRFVPFSRVKEIEGLPVRLALRMLDGSAVVLARQDLALEQQLRDAFERYKAHGEGSADDHAHLLHRRDRSPEIWQADLKKLAHAQDYRAEGLDAETLATVVSDARADPEQRVAAALALPKSEETRTRIRIAAQSSADEDVQRALAAAADDELAEAELARAMRRRA